MHSFTLPLRPLVRASGSFLSHAHPSSSSRAAPLATQLTQARHASVLGSLSDNPSAYKKRIRRGRGPGSGKGKTSGRGHKGQGQHGKVPAGFQGGQTPLEKVHGKRGYVNFFSVDMSLCNLNRLQEWIDNGRIDPTRHITLKELQESRCIHQVKDGVKLLARDAFQLRQPIHITVSRASAAAIAAVEAAGGSVTTRYYTRPSIARILEGTTHPALSIMSTQQASADADADAYPAEAANAAAQHAAASPSEPAQPSSIQGAYPPPEQYRFRLPDAYSRRDIEYYRDAAHRGYLSHMVAPGQSPSLFFKTPAQNAASGESRARKRKGAGASASANRLF